MKKSFFIIVFFFSLFIGKEAFADVYNWVELTNLSIVNDLYGYPVSAVDITDTEITDTLLCDIEINSSRKSASVWTGYFNDPNSAFYFEGVYGFGCDFNGTPYYWWSETEPILFLGNNYQFLSTNSLQALPEGEYHFRYFSDGNTSYYFNFDIYANGYGEIKAGPPAISSITPSYPVNTTIQPPENINQTIKVPVTLTGNYENVDEYNYILVYGLDEGILGREYVLCESDIGESGEYSCSVDFWTNKTYNYEMIMTNTPAPSSPSVSSGVKSFSIGDPFIPSNDFLTSEEEECDGYTDIYCHLKNAFRWGFIPSKATLYKFVSLSNKIMERAPFGYAKIIYQKLENLQLDETNNIELVSLEAIDEMIYSPFRVAFSYILYFVFVVGLYFRFRNINI